MGGFDSFFLAVANGLTPQINMVITRAAGIACSVADIAFILILLKTSFTIKGPDVRPPRKRLAVLYLFLALTPTLAFPINTGSFLIWQSFVVGLPYLILAYCVVVELPVVLRHIRSRVREDARN